MEVTAPTTGAFLRPLPFTCGHLHAMCRALSSHVLGPDRVRSLAGCWAVTSVRGTWCPLGTLSSTLPGFPAGIRAPGPDPAPLSAFPRRRLGGLSWGLLWPSGCKLHVIVALAPEVSRAPRCRGSWGGGCGLPSTRSPPRLVSRLPHLGHLPGSEGRTWLSSPAFLLVRALPHICSGRLP